MIAVGWMFVVLALMSVVYLWALRRVERAENERYARNLTQLRARQIDTLCETNAARWNRTNRKRDGIEVER